MKKLDEIKLNDKVTPSLAALGWIISDTAVFGNSLLVRKFKIANLI